MKVYIGQDFSENSGGMYRVITGLKNALVKKGITLVDSIEEADVVNAHIAVYEDIPTNKPLVVSSHGMLWSTDQWGKSGKKTNDLCLSSYRQADVVTAPSQFVAHAIQRHSLVKPRIVPHGIDGWKPGTNEGYVLWNKARQDAACNPADMNALASMTDLQFVSTFGSVTNNVQIIGRVSPEDMRQYVENAGVYLNTSRESGGPCFGVLEALSCGVPVLAWNYGGTSEAIEHGKTGYLAEPGNFADLLKGLNFCIEHREEMSPLCIEEAKKYSWDNVVNYYIKAYQEAIDICNRPVEISVIIPCYNLGKYVKSAVESVLNQDFDSFEVIVVNDASKDTSKKVLDALYDPRLTVLHNKVNLHVSDSRNRAIAQAKGKYILPLDADDRLVPNALSTLHKKIITNRNISAVSGKLRLFQDGKWDSSIVGEWPNNADPALQFKGYNRLPYSTLYRKELWKRTGGYRRRIRNGVEDADFWTRMFYYGYTAEIIDNVTLLYTLRENSLGKQNQHGSAAWLSWFSAKLPYESVLHYSPPEVSVIIPVGPGHEHHLQACLDSLVAQSFTNWEAIVVNDTGKRWGDSLSLPARILDYGSSNGVAWARNAGIYHSKGKFIVFLDADDVAQPNMLAILLKAQEITGGWVYGDWYSHDGTAVKYNQAPDWRASTFLNKQLAPITGIYEKEHLVLIGGFDESAPGWEDWDLQLRLFGRGICGSRVNYPLITYNMHFGARREENFANKDFVLQFIKDKHNELFNYFRKGNVMPCSACGGKPTVTPQTPTQLASDMVLLVYVGPETQSRHFKPAGSTFSYKVSYNVPFYATAADAEFFLRISGFSLVEQIVPVAAQETIPLVSQEQVISYDAPVSELELPYENLLEGYTVSSLDKATDEELLAIKGIGPAKVSAIREKVEAWKHS